MPGGRTCTVCKQAGTLNESLLVVSTHLQQLVQLGQLGGQPRADGPEPQAAVAGAADGAEAAAASQTAVPEAESQAAVLEIESQAAVLEAESQAAGPGVES